MPPASASTPGIDPKAAIVFAGIPATNLALYHRIRFNCGDPTAYIEWPEHGGQRASTLIIRDIEVERARKQSPADEVHPPAAFAPSGGLSGDRETATAQALAECLRRGEAKRVVAGRTLPLIYADHIRHAGLDVEYSADLGVAERRGKDEQEIEALRAAQSVTEAAMLLACRRVAAATPDATGVLQHEGEPLTAERVRHEIDVFLLARDFLNPRCIVAPGRIGGDCHDAGTGPIRTGEPVIIDIFPMDRSTRYNGDCTRTVVHGEIPDTVRKMHAAVLDAKQAAIAAARPGVTGEDVHRAAIDRITEHGFGVGLPGPDDPPDAINMTHGTGHGVGLEVHEPPLLDMGGPELVKGDCLTVEPGLYGKAIGGVRVEDMIILTEDGCENLNHLPQGLDSWSD